MSRWLSLCVLFAGAVTLGCSGDVGDETPTGPAFGEPCGESSECGSGLSCRPADTLCVGGHTVTVNLDFAAESQRRFEPINLGLVSLDDRELIADAQVFDPALVLLFSAIDAPSDWPGQIQFDGVPTGEHWIVMTMDLPSNMTSYADQLFEFRSDGTLLDAMGQTVTVLDAVFYAELPVGTL